MAFLTGDIVPLNRTEHGYAAIEGLAATMVQPYLIRLDGPVDVTAVRRVMRELVTAYPKLRAKLEPGWHRYHLRILPDDDIVDQLFDWAFRIDTQVDLDDPAQVEAWQRQLINEVLPLERGLGLRVRFAPHPQQPALLFGVPHILADGMTMVQLVRQILRGLNGQPLEPMPLEAPAMIGSIAPHRWWQWPRQVLKARRHKVAEARRLATLHIQQVPTRLGLHYSTTGLRLYEATTGTAELRALARQAGVSLNTLLIAALAQTFLEQAPDVPQAAAVIRISVNLRRFYPPEAGHGPLWGNHVGAFLVIEQDAHKPWPERLRSVDASIREGQARYERREMCWTYLWDELVPWLGRTLIGHIGVQLKRKQRFPVISCHATSLGDANAVNEPGARVRAAQLFGVVNSISPLPVLTEMNGRLFVPTAWQLSETSHAEMSDFLQRFDRTLARLVSEARPPGATLRQRAPHGGAA